MSATLIEGRRIRLRGIVQGVGMRPWIYRLARQHGVSGSVRNETSGVTIDAFAAGAVLENFISALRQTPPPAAAIEALEYAPIPQQDASGFVIVDSRHADERRVSIPPDLATCDDCAAEILDPSNRRYRYPFTNCTNCGPRFTIATDVPYDRPATTMARFPMCEACRREYEDPLDRRFHAQPNACPDCGPRLTVLDPSGMPVTVDDAVAFAAAQIDDGLVVALKGLGGFHLACDATSPAAVSRLRSRKHRDEKPFAVMVRDIEEAERLAIVGPQARRLLLSAERPIVLVRRREALCDEVAPRNPLVGLMLPYTPLHHLLLRACGRPLVMTSANLSDEPIAYRNDEAVARLKDIADTILVHDRDIVTRCEDSIATVIASRPVLLRRSRGYVPRPIRLPIELRRPVLATGALVKNTFCLAHGRDAWLGPHVGDLENAETFAAFEEAVARLERFVGVRGEVLAHDRHPDYLSTRYAQDRDRAAAVAIQHHHAHVVSAMADRGLVGPVVGIAFDGTGYGTDGTAWGGEFLVATRTAFERVATFRPVALPGGDLAIRQPWRIAVALLADAFGRNPPLGALPLFRGIRESDVLMVRQMLAVQLNCPAARGVGRYFDAFGALALNRPRASYEGQVAFELNMAAAPDQQRRYGFELDHSRAPFEIDLRQATCDAVADLLADTPAAIVSARFHNTLVAATSLAVRQIAREHGALPAVLTGGCFQNARLAEGVASALALATDVYLHERVPPGDGGIALGQALAAAEASA